VDRRLFLQAAGALGLASALGPARDAQAGPPAGAVAADQLPALAGALTLYLGRGEGGLYEDVVAAIRERNPALELNIRRGPSAALANTLVAEAGAGVRKADLFWAIDAGSLGLVAAQGMARAVPAEITEQLRAEFRFPNWTAISGRIRTVAYNPDRVDPGALPTEIMAFADSDYHIGWAPAYGAFQSFLTAMRLLEGDAATREWLEGIKPRASEYAGELGAVMAVSRGEVDLAFANHYYTLRLKQGRPDAPVALHFTEDDAGALVNASGAVVLGPGDTPIDFVRYLLTREVQSYLAREAFELPLVPGVPGPPGLPPLAEIDPPKLDLTRLADLRPTLALMREAGVL
jgi:iron(III) transport system substrate-binding protein